MIPPAPSRADEAVQRSLQRRQEAARAEVARLIEAGRDLFGSGGNPRVTDVVRAAGVSIEAFYRYFGSKSEFAAAVAEDGAARVMSYVEHKTACVGPPPARLRALVDALMSQAAQPDLASAARNILGRSDVASASPRGPSPFEAASATCSAPCSSTWARPTRTGTLVPAAPSSWVPCNGSCGPSRRRPRGTART